MRRRRPLGPLADLPEGHTLVLQILAEAGRELEWDELRTRAAEVGIGEEELRLIMFGRPKSDAAEE